MSTIRSKDLQYEAMVDLYKTGLSSRQVASHFKCSQKLVMKAIIKAGVSRRKNGNSHEDFLRRIKVVDNTGCWEWQGCLNNRGYGYFSMNNKSVQTHRYSYGFYKTNPNELCVLHKCDNPKCCNPDHLFLGTLKDNAVDAARKGRVKNAILDIAKAKEIKTLLKKGESSHKEIASMYGVGSETISHINTNRKWAHVDVGDEFRY